MDKIAVLEDVIEKICRSDDNVWGEQSYTHHIKPVIELAKKYASVYGADYETTVIAAILHDIASVTRKEYKDKHHIIGVGLAFDLIDMLGLDIESDQMVLIQKCILNHRGSAIKDKSTNEEKCVADVDAMAHIFEMPSIYRLAFQIKNLDLKDGTMFVRGKLWNSHNKLSEIGKSIVYENYEAAHFIIEEFYEHKILFNEPCSLETPDMVLSSVPYLFKEVYQNPLVTVLDGAREVEDIIDKSYSDSLDDKQKRLYKSAKTILRRSY